jgi:hypothetical protein
MVSSEDRSLDLAANLKRYQDYPDTLLSRQEQFRLEQSYIKHFNKHQNKFFDAGPDRFSLIIRDYGDLRPGKLSKL